jgi:hypothetical protein
MPNLLRDDLKAGSAVLGRSHCRIHRHVQSPCPSIAVKPKWALSLHVIPNRSNCPCHIFFTKSSLEHLIFSRVNNFVEYCINKIHKYLEYHSACPLVQIETPHPLSRKRVCPPPPGTKGRTHSPSGEGVGGDPNSDDWKKNLALSLLCDCMYCVQHCEASFKHSQFFLKITKK